MQLANPLVILDLETTGTWIEKDKIIEVALIRLEPDGTRETYHKKVNPEIRIPAKVSKITGITNEEVRQAPRFRDIAAQVMLFLANADLGGFSLERFDLPLLTREFADAGMEFKWGERTIFDAQKIYHLHEKRDLTAAYAFYCNKELVGAHSAIADTQATLEVLESQLKKYGKGSEQISSLADFEYKKREEFYDKGRRVRWWNGELYMMFGKYAAKDSLKEVVQKDRHYLEWILSQNFSDEVKDLVEGALEGNFPVYEEEEEPAEE